MHELALADAIVQVCCDSARGRRVAKVELEVGRLRQVVPDALSFAFDLVARGTPADGAELEIANVPVRVRCRGCRVETEVDEFPLACVRCGGLDVDVTNGEEFHVVALELDDELALETRHAVRR
jgi:hydrogenase nickel incorporation protein HypA/HybF